jgi:hypothetical protein
MKRYFVIVFSIIVVFSLKGQNPNTISLISNQGYQGTSSASNVTVDSIGNIYVIGGFTGTVDFNPSPSSANWLYSTSGMNSYYIQKLDSNGNFIWAKKIEFTYGNLRHIEVDKTGRTYIMGFFKDSVDIDPGTSVYRLFSRGESDVFSLKLSANGNFIWANSFGGTGNDIVYDFAIDEKGNLFSHGTFEDTVDFDPGSGQTIYISGHTNFGDNLESAFTQKLDQNGNFIWAKPFLTIDTCGYCNGISIDLDKNSNIYCTGWFAGNFDFDPGNDIHIPSLYEYGTYVEKLDSLGNMLWVKFSNMIYGGSSAYSYPRMIRIDNNNDILLTGQYSGKVDFDPSGDTAFGINTVNRHAFLQKLDTDGNFIWIKSYGDSSGSVFPMAISIDYYNNIYTTGYFKDSADFDPDLNQLMLSTVNIINYNNFGSFFQKVNSKGDLIWAGVLRGNQGRSYGLDICNDKNYNVLAVGFLQDTLDIDLSSGINNQVFPSQSSYLLKLSQCQTLTTDNQTACDSLTWMDGVTYYKSTNSAYFTLPSAAGCDSVICLNLTVPVIDTTISVNTTGIFNSNQSSASYQWLDCNNGLSPLTGETLQNFTPTANGSYAVALDVSGCVDTSACVSIQNVGIEEIEGYIIKLFPNPATTHITLDLGAQNQKIESVNIFTVAGQKVLILNNVQSDEPIDVQSLKPGIYLLEGVLESGERFVGKFVKE